LLPLERASTNEGQSLGDNRRFLVFYVEKIIFVEKFMFFSDWWSK
jgi:hypothetical protein